MHHGQWSCGIRRGESSGAPVWVSRPLMVGTRTTGDWSPAALDHPQHTIKLSCLSVNTNNERRAGSREPHQDIKRNISYFVRDSSFHFKIY